PRQTIDKAGSDWIDDGHEYHWHGARCLQQQRQTHAANSQNDLGAQARPVPPRICEPYRHRPQASDSQSSRFGRWSHPIAAALAGRLRCCAAPHPLALLRPRRERPRCRSAEQRDEHAATDVDGHVLTRWCLVRTAGHSGLMLAARITLLHFSVSLTLKVSK